MILNLSATVLYFGFFNLLHLWYVPLFDILCDFVRLLLLFYNWVAEQFVTLVTQPFNSRKVLPQVANENFSLFLSFHHRCVSLSKNDENISPGPPRSEFNSNFWRSSWVNRLIFASFYYYLLLIKSFSPEIAPNHCRKSLFMLHEISVKTPW